MPRHAVESHTIHDKFCKEPVVKGMSCKSDPPPHVLWYQCRALTVYHGMRRPGRTSYGIELPNGLPVLQRIVDSFDIVAIAEGLHALKNENVYTYSFVNEIKGMCDGPAYLK